MQSTVVDSPIVRASGVYDFVLLLPFAIPGISGWLINKIGALNSFLSLPGTVPDFSPFALMFVNMMAALAVLYSVLRIRQPNRLYGGYDIVARLLMASLILIYLLVFNIAAVMWVFFAVEIIWAAAQYRAISLK